MYRSTSLVSLIAVLVVTVLVVSYFVSLGKITVNEGIVITVVVVIVSPLLQIILPPLITIGLQPKVSLKVDKIEFQKRVFHGVEGHQIKALVTNKGKKICSNLTASFSVKDADNRSPNLLSITFSNRDFQPRTDAAEEPMRSIGYAWKKDNENECLGDWKELRQKDCVYLLFPYETHFFDGADTNPYRDSIAYNASEVLLKLIPNHRYKIVIEVKGEDSERITAIGKKEKTLTFKRIEGF